MRWLSLVQWLGNAIVFKNMSSNLDADGWATHRLPVLTGCDYISVLSDRNILTWTGIVKVSNLLTLKSFLKPFVNSHTRSKYISNWASEHRQLAMISQTLICLSSVKGRAIFLAVNSDGKLCQCQDWIRCFLVC